MDEFFVTLLRIYPVSGCTPTLQQLALGDGRSRYGTRKYGSIRALDDDVESKLYSCCQQGEEGCCEEGEGDG